MSDTHRGELMGIPATGKSFVVNNAATCRFTSDVAAMMRQLGVGA